MSETGMVLKIDASQFTIRVYEDLLKIDLKGSLKNEIEEGLENKPILKETIGKILGIFVPLHIQADDIKSVYMSDSEKPTVSIDIVNHREIVLPFEHREDAEKLVEKLKQMILITKERERAKIVLKNARKRAERKKYRKRPRAERRV
jgi:hypothetical protein